MNLLHEIRRIGNISLLVALVLLGVLNATAPTLANLGLLTVSNEFALYDGASPVVTYGTFGFCVKVIPENAKLDVSGTHCVEHSIGYDVTTVIEATYGYHTAKVPGNTARAVARLTQVFILIPIATVACVLALGLSVYPIGCPGIRMRILVAGALSFAFACSFVVAVSSLVVFGAFRDALETDGTSTRGAYGVGMWALLAATLCLLCAAIMRIFAYCIERTERSARSYYTEKLWGEIAI